MIGSGLTVEFSRRERAAISLLKTERSRARSGRLQRLVRRSGIGRSSVTRMRRPHHFGIRPCTTSVRSLSRPAHDHARHTGLLTEPRSSGITLPITGFQHNGPSYNSLHNRLSAQRAFVPHKAQRAPGRRETGTTGVQKARFVPSDQKRDDADAPRTPNGLGISCRERAGRCLQKANDLAREAVSCMPVLDGTGSMVADAVA
jgi:hypothetical protein